MGIAPGCDRTLIQPFDCDSVELGQICIEKIF